MQVKYDELMAERQLLQLKVKEKQMKEQKEQREKALLRMMEEQIRKKVKKTAKWKGTEDSDAEEEEPMTLVGALKH